MGYLAVSATKHCAVGTPYPLPLMTRDANMHFDFAIQPPTNVIDLLSQGRENVWPVCQMVVNDDLRQTDLTDLVCITYSYEQHLLWKVTYILVTYNML